MTIHQSRPRAQFGLLLVGGVLVAGLAGCDADSYFDPSVQGYWEAQPSTLPILSQLDTIETGDDGWGQVTDPTPEDLVPSDLSYEFSPGDFVTVQIFELYAQGQWAATTRRIDPGGFLRVQELGDVQAAGLTPQELQDILTEAYSEMITLPQVDVVLEQGSGFQYTVYGLVQGQGMYNLTSPDLRLIDALAQAGGVPQGVDEVFVIRTVELSESVRPRFQRESPVEESESGRPVDIDGLIDRFDDPAGGVSPGGFAGHGGYGLSGILGQDGEPAIDVEDLEPAIRRPAGGPDMGRGTPVRSGAWVYDEQRGEWVRTSAEPANAGRAAGPGGEPPLFVERVIRIPVEDLQKGRADVNVVIRPDDRIYVEPPLNGIVYLEGEVARPGPYQIPANSTYTLSRLVAAAGGLGALAIPERVDITRMVGTEREATITVNFAAIRHRTEPDILLKPDDHVNIGTSFWATPLAVIRNGFRATYGFGFLLDRNFGNDVFGAPPTNVGNG